MKIKKYEGTSEKDAMLKVKEELGKEALIVSVKNIKPRGLYRLFKRPYVEVTAALDDRSLLDERDKEVAHSIQPEKIVAPSMGVENEDREAYIDKFKSFVDRLPNMEGSYKEVEKKDESVVKVVYEQLLDNEVKERVVNQLMSGTENLERKDENGLSDVILVVYRRIIKLLAEPKGIQIEKDHTVFFVGPTGVGKTTTIAKIASYFTLNLGKKVALITADTYRIAAVEQLRTYANILDIPIKVVYTKGELKEAIKAFKEKDLILIDTAGRSHKNEAHQEELSELLEVIQEKQVFLVLSVATKYKDLAHITDVYSMMTHYKIIFTKLDETSCYGNILNIKLKTNAPLSYITFGQNVPDDISDMNPHEIARQILGGNV